MPLSRVVTLVYEKARTVVRAFVDFGSECFLVVGFSRRRGKRLSGRFDRGGLHGIFLVRREPILCLGRRV